MAEKALMSACTHQGLTEALEKWEVGGALQKSFVLPLGVHSASGAEHS